MADILQPIHHEAAWVGDELQQRDEWSYQLNAENVRELLTAANHHPVYQFRAGALQEPAIVLPRLAAKLASMQERLENGSGAVRICGFPADEVDSTTAKAAFWHLCRHLGWPLSQSATDDRLFDVRDAGLPDDDQRARGPNTRKKLSFHTDRCDVIGFLCYRQAKTGGDNQVVSSVSLFNAMLRDRPDLTEVLTKPFLYQRHNVDTANQTAYIEQPVFSVHEGHFASNLLRVLIERAYKMPDTPAMSSQQREALDYLEELAARKAMHCQFRLQHGDMLFLNNFVTLHRRTEFVDHDSPERKRHLFRIWLSMPNSRPLAPGFAGNYGSTQAGAIRGGMRPGR